MKKILFILFFIFITIPSAQAFQINNKNIGDLKYKKTNKTVKQLQIFLNENGFYESEEGPGSPGNETEYFGDTTVAAVKIFQEYSEVPVTGKIDFKTAKAINKFTKDLEEAQKSIDDYVGEESRTPNIDIGERYNLNNELDNAYKGDINEKYKNDIVDSYTNKPKQENKSKATNIKDMLEATKARSEPKTKNTNQKQEKSIFQRFFSIFE